MPSVPMVWAPVHSAWNHEALISSWMGQGRPECGLRNAECRLKKNPNSGIEKPMLALYMYGTGLPARPGLAPRPTTQFFPGEKATYGHA